MNTICIYIYIYIYIYQFTIILLYIILYQLITILIGVKSRQRLCDSPAPKVNGLPCPGSGEQVVSCNENVTCPG